MTDSGVLAAIGMALAGVVWAVRVEGKVVAHDREIEQLRHDTDTKVEQVLRQLDYIRERIDRVLEERAR